MKTSTLFLVLLFALVSADDSSKIILKKTSDTYHIDMKSDDYKNLAKQNQGLPDAQQGFFIGRLEKESIPNNVQTGTLGIKIKKEDSQSSEVSTQVICGIMDFTSVKQGYNLYCPVDDEYDTIILNPQDTDTIVIKDIGKITIAKSLPKSGNSSSMISPSLKNILLIIGLILFI